MKAPHYSKISLLIKLIIFSGLLFFSGLAAAQESAGVYIKPMPSMPSTLDPKYYTDGYSINIATQIYDRLFDVDEYLTLRPKLVERFDSKENGRIWTIYLKKGVRFHNGQELGTKDVEFSIKRLLEPNSVKYNDLSLIKGAKEFHEGKTKTVAGLKILSDDVIEIELATPFQPFLTIFSAPNTEILPENFAERAAADFFNAPIGTGAFKFGTSEPDKFIELIANENYFLAKPILKKVKFEKAGLEEAINKFNLGYYHDLEWYFDVSPLKLKRSYTVIKAPSAATYLFAFNTRNKPLNDVHLRKAIELAIPRNKILEACFPDRNLANGIVPPGIGGYYPEINPIEYNPAKAREELGKAHLTANELKKELTILRPDNHPCQESFTKIVESSLKSAGINAKVKHLPLKSIYSDYYQPNKYDIVNLYYTSDGPESFLMLNRFRSDASHNYTGVKSKEIDILLDEAMANPNRYDRYNLYRKIQDLIQRNAYVIPLSYNVYTGVYQSYVKGIKEAPLTIYNVSMVGVYFDSSQNSNVL